MKVTIDVETKTFVRFLVIVSAFVAVVFLAWKLWAALMIVIVSFFLALALNPPVSALSRRLPGQSRVAATAISYLFVLAVLGLFIYVAVPPVIDQTTRFIDALPQYVNELSERRGVLADLINRYQLEAQVNQVVASIQQQSSALAQGIGSSLVGGVTSFLSGFVTMVTVLVMTFLMLIEGPRWMERLWHLYSDDEKLQRHQRLAAKMYKVVSGFVNGQVLVAGIAAASGFVALIVLTYFFNVPIAAALPLAGVIFITDLVPMIGSTIGAIIVSLVLLFSDPVAVIAFLAYFIVYQQIENNFLQPLVQSRTVALSALSVILALIVGISLLGIVGGIIAIPIAGCLRVILLDHMKHRKHKAKPKAGVFAKVLRQKNEEV